LPPVCGRASRWLRARSRVWASATRPARQSWTVGSRAADQEAYTGRLAAFERRWPADPKSLVARRLQEFLDISADVDFDAKLVPAGKLMRFADPRYEEKPPTWKLCFRSGREAVAAAREAAHAWLKAI
jgi:hypothetical protein